MNDFATIETVGKRAEEREESSPRSRLSAWHLARSEYELRIYHDGGNGGSQVAALHQDSSYLRLCPGPDCGWGTSIVLLPALWSHEQLFQGAAVAVDWRLASDRLLLSARGRIGLIEVTLEVEIDPPAGGRMSARVQGRSSGKMHLDRREGEAFRLVTLSSMRIGKRHWDARSALADGRAFPLEKPGWILGDGALARRFALVGGSSDWKTNAPTVEVVLDRRHRVGGWLTRSTNPSGDNVSLWAAAASIARAWSYTIHASRPD